jgi:hypothetical protein
MLLVGAALAIGGACGATSGFADDEPTNGGALEPGELAAVPLPGGTAPFTVPTQKAGAVTQSFKVTGLSPADVLRFYASGLPGQGWAVSTAPVEDGAGVWRGLWALHDRLLQVTAEPDVDDGSGDGDGAPTSQLDLELRAAP